MAPGFWYIDDLHLERYLEDSTWLAYRLRAKKQPQRRLISKAPLSFSRKGRRNAVSVGTPYAISPPREKDRVRGIYRVKAVRMRLRGRLPPVA
jgi:hypothetical protein